MVLLAINETDFFFDGAEKVFDPEHEFLIEIKTAMIKGFLDVFTVYKDRAVIRDWKSKGSKFTAKELESNFQASVYQLYVWKNFKLPAEVEFVMLRHPPTSRTPKKHMQVVPAKTAAQLKGFELFLEHMGTVFKNFNLEDAYSNFAADDPARKSFCQYVCQYKNPFEYQAILKNEKLVRTAFLNELPNLQEGETVEIRTHKGCPKFHPL